MTAAGGNAPSESERRITDATFRAPCEHGYVDLSIANVADEFDEGIAPLSCHYDYVDELRVDDGGDDRGGSDPPAGVPVVPTAARSGHRSG